MGHAATELLMGFDDFIAWEHGKTVRHEFVRGETLAMAGGEDRNATVALNIAMALRTHLRGAPCRTFITDVKLRVEAADCVFHPDVFVTCSTADAADRLIKREAMLVVEMLSTSTTAYDRGDKFADYRRLPSLCEYLLVDPLQRRCDLYRKGADGLWVLHPSEFGADVLLASVDCTISADALWEEVPPADAPARAAP